jgi:hypothetical protein
MPTTQKSEFKAPSQMADHTAAPAIISSVTQLVGTWKNVDKSTNDIVEIIITGAGSKISVEVFGACVPTPCKWGTVKALAYAANVSSTEAMAFSAQYHFSFSKVIVVGHLAEKHLLVETFTEFTDGSGRSNLYTADTLAK